MPARNNGNSNGGGWQRFSPMPPRPSSESTRPAARPESMIGQGGPAGRPSLGRPSPDRPPMDSSVDRSRYGNSRSSAPESRSYSSQGQAYSRSSRPSLNIRHPFLTPRPDGVRDYASD